MVIHGSEFHCSNRDSFVATVECPLAALGDIGTLSRFKLLSNPISNLFENHKTYFFERSHGGGE